MDIFSSAYPHTLTEKGHALVADYSLPPKSSSARLETEGHLNTEVKGLHVSMYSKRFFEQFTPILPDCECYTCQNFTCAYIHHLLNTKELLAYVLLTIHNFHQFFLFFQRLREVAREGRVEELRASLERQSEGGEEEGGDIADGGDQAVSFGEKGGGIIADIQLQMDSHIQR